LVAARADEEDVVGFFLIYPPMRRFDVVAVVPCEGLYYLNIALFPLELLSATLLNELLADFSVGPKFSIIEVKGLASDVWRVKLIGGRVRQPP